MKQGLTKIARRFKRRTSPRHCRQSTTPALWFNYKKLSCIYATQLLGLSRCCPTTTALPF